MKKIYLLLWLAITASCCFGQKNLTLLADFSLGATGAGCWHYEAGGHEYALAGTGSGLSIIDITNPGSAKLIYKVPDVHSIWREVRTYGHYAYVSNEGIGIQGFSSGGGLLIVNLENLPDTPVTYKKYTFNGLSTAHTVQVSNGYLYVNGVNGYGKTNIYSLADPWNPVYVGVAGTDYVHDCYIRGDTIVTCEVYIGKFSISRISDKAHPVKLVTNSTPAAYNHNAEMSDDGRYLYTTDEVANAAVGAYDISNYQNIKLVDTYRTIKTPSAEVHNVHVFGDFLVNACYGSQVTLVDASRPFNLIEIGNYPTGTNVCWDADPFTASGNIIANDYDGHLYVFAPTYQHACFLEGNVTDSITGLALNAVKVEILNPPSGTNALATDNSLFTGNYKTGWADSGVYNVKFSKTGYLTKVISVELKNGLLTELNTKLWNGIPTGTEEQDLPSGVMKVYPNPVQNDATIRIDKAFMVGKRALHLLVTDALGRTVREIADISEPVITLSRRELANGTYIIQLMDDKNRIAETTVVFQ